MAVLRDVNSPKIGCRNPIKSFSFKMRILIIWFTVTLTIFVHVMANKELFYDEKRLVENAWRLSEASNQFGFNLLRDLSNRTSNNIVFSPISIATTFGLLYYGSGGKTAKELEKVLGYEGANLSSSTVPKAFRYLLTNHLVTIEPKAYVLDMASAMFVNEHLTLSSVYKAKAEEFYQSPVEVVNFDGGASKAVERINEFVWNKTMGMICNIVDYLDPYVDLVAVNAAYFKSKWMSPFLESNTRDRIFYNNGKDEKMIPMMEQEGTFMYYTDDQVSIVHLGFWGRNISILVLLPTKADGLQELEESLTHDKLVYYLLSTYPKHIRLTIPKFNLSYSSDLSPSLQALGARDIFQPAAVNLTGMALEERIVIGEVKHKAIIEVNEAGVQASGVTATFSFKSMSLPEALASNFTADHPFMFVVLDERTDLVVLMGRVWTL